MFDKCLIFGFSIKALQKGSSWNNFFHFFFILKVHFYNTQNMFNLDTITNESNKDHNKKMAIRTVGYWTIWIWKTSCIT